MKELRPQLEKNIELIENYGLYDKTLEHSSCGVGLIANIRGNSSNEIVIKSLEA